MTDDKKLFPHQIDLSPNQIIAVDVGFGKTDSVLTASVNESEPVVIMDLEGGVVPELTPELLLFTKTMFDWDSVRAKGPRIYQPAAEFQSRSRLFRPKRKKPHIKYIGGDPKLKRGYNETTEHHKHRLDRMKKRLAKRKQRRLSK